MWIHIMNDVCGKLAHKRSLHNWKLNNPEKVILERMIRLQHFEWIYFVLLNPNFAIEHDLTNQVLPIHSK